MTKGPRQKLVDRFEVLGARVGGDRVTDPWSPHHYEGFVDGTLVRILTLHYETHFDARLGATGLRAAGYTILGIRDLHTGELVDSSELKRSEDVSWL